MSLTGFKDLDRKILLDLDDSDIISYCKINKNARNICQEDLFWKLRINRKFPGHLERVVLNENNKPKYFKSWKDYYIYMVRPSMIYVLYDPIYEQIHEFSNDPLTLFNQFHKITVSSETGLYDKKYFLDLLEEVNNIEDVTEKESKFVELFDPDTNFEEEYHWQILQCNTTNDKIPKQCQLVMNFNATKPYIRSDIFNLPKGNYTEVFYRLPREDLLFPNYNTMVKYLENEYAVYITDNTNIREEYNPQVLNLNNYYQFGIDTTL